MWYNRPASVEAGSDAIVGWTSGDDRSVRVARLSGSRVRDIETLHKWRYADDHGSPILHRIERGAHAGAVLAVYALHNSDLLARRSTSADIRRWGPERVVMRCACSYPALVDAGATLYLFYARNVDPARGTRSYFVRASTDEGDTFGKETEVVRAAAGQWIYGIPFVDGNGQIALVWNVQEDGAKNPHDLFFARLETLLRSPRSYATFAVYRSPPGFAARAWDVRLDDDGQPVVLTIDYAGEATEGYWRKQMPDGQWRDVPLGAGSFAYYPCGAVFGRDAHTIWMGKAKPAGGVLEELAVDDRAGAYRTVAEVANPRGSGLCRPTMLASGALAFSVVGSIQDFMHFDTPLAAIENTTR